VVRRKHLMLLNVSMNCSRQKLHSLVLYATCHASPRPPHLLASRYIPFSRLCANITCAMHSLMITIIAGIVFIIVGVMFRSLFVPIRLLITIALPICLVYGLGVLVFEQGLLFWKKVEALYWLAPVMSFSILVGLGLDYDVFLFSRVVEYRRMGYTDRASILKGVYKTGGIITAAGIIMAIAFTGPTMSNQLVLNEFGFMLCVAVLVDTFVVRYVFSVHLLSSTISYPFHTLLVVC
jgi:uncharacterized membrane protein YdfJ with MMPL/SSD domain